MPWHAGDEFECTHTNIYEANMGPGMGPQTQRPSDGYWTSSWRRRLMSQEEGYSYEVRRCSNQLAMGCCICSMGCMRCQADGY